jgi:isoleucyl-tRNA synthetase
MMDGYSVRMIPGWDAHGLPVELKAVQESHIETKQSSALFSGTFETSSKNLSFSPMEIRRRAASIAEKYISIQKDQFMKWGILADWRSSYTTMGNKAHVYWKCVFILGLSRQVF